MAFSRIARGKWGGVIITKFGTRVYVCCVMMVVNFGVGISRDVDSALGQSSGFSIYLVFGPYDSGIDNELMTINQNFIAQKVNLPSN